ncbi:hypothetical protein ACE1B6_25870 [Aerosakkonemataceae cyanobacterium BLCC-F154]|uniref:Uncharacterized protein n=1 Tax=Floridaenema fluviatile BLCC-F154 TaxID=3153640 RepID=A0ABV4YIP1_9CYAN
MTDMKKKLVNGKVIIGLGLSIIALKVCSLQVLAQSASERYPTTTELVRLREKLRSQIRKLENENEFKDFRSSADKQRLASLVSAWAKVDPIVAPFLGYWSGYEESLLIYPANTKGRVCIIYEGLGENELYFGNVVNGEIRTDEKQTIIKEGDYLAVASVRNNQPDIFVTPPFMNPRITLAMSEFMSRASMNRPDIAVMVQKFKASGCRDGLPSKR